VSPPEIAIGSRGSPLALAQAMLVVDALPRVGLQSHIVIVQTEGDRRPPDAAWGGETDDLVAFGELVRALRSTESRRSTVSDTPILLGIHRSIDEILALLGADQ
jgi:hypothetical protein